MSATKSKKIAYKAAETRSVDRLSHVRRYDVVRTTERAREMLQMALDTFARLDAAAAAGVIDRDDEIDAAFLAIMRQLISYMMEDPAHDHPGARDRLHREIDRAHRRSREEHRRSGRPGGQGNRRSARVRRTDPRGGGGRMSERARKPAKGASARLSAPDPSIRSSEDAPEGANEACVAVQLRRRGPARMRPGRRPRTSEAWGRPDAVDPRRRRRACDTRAPPGQPGRRRLRRPCATDAESAQRELARRCRPHPARLDAAGQIGSALAKELRGDARTRCYRSSW